MTGSGRLRHRGDIATRLRDPQSDRHCL